MSRRLNDLSPRLRPLAVELLARCAEAGIAVLVVDTVRTPQEHALNLTNGVSWTLHSKHLDGRIRGWPWAGSDAIDLAPYEQYQLHGAKKLEWDAVDPVWLRLGLLGESLGLRWGGRWQTPDLGHFEDPGPATGPGLVEV